MKRELKRLLLFVLIVLIVTFGILQLIKKKVISDLAQPIVESIISPSPTLTIEKNQQAEKSVFVPYWALASSEAFDTSYDTYLYFGISPDENGIKKDIGLARMENFLKSVPDGKGKLLVLRMVDADINTKVLKDSSIQKRIVNQTVKEAKENGFQGVVLDLEMSAIPFNSLIEQITNFNTILSKAVKDEGMSHMMTIYGDTFYRVRPYDVKSLAQDTDMFLLMAYDFHKSRGNPGPNFPLEGRGTYGYDLQEMLEDYLRIIPSRKITVIFGMFGYDWVVDDAGKAVGQAKALTYEEIEHQFLNGCNYTACQISRDRVSSETKISYIDETDKKHIVWFEDTQSVNAKQKYLESMGIVKYAYWAYTYF